MGPPCVCNNEQTQELTHGGHAIPAARVITYMLWTLPSLDTVLNVGGADSTRIKSSTIQLLNVLIPDYTNTTKPYPLNNQNVLMYSRSILKQLKRSYL